MAPNPMVPVEESAPGPKPIVGVATTATAILGETRRGPLRPRLVTSLSEYEAFFGTGGPFLPAAVRGFFQNGGKRVFVCRLKGADGLAKALAALADPADPAIREVALVAAPGLTDREAIGAIVDHCEAHRRFCVFDCPRADPATLDPGSVRPSSYAAAYAPWLEIQVGAGAIRVPPSGHVMGIYIRTDTSRGVWTAPANAELLGVAGLEYAIDEAVQAQLNPRGVNVIRRFAGRGLLVWGARTLSRDPEWKYVSVRRLQIFLERSIAEATQWAAFEPNGEPLWTQVRTQVEAFLQRQWQAGALRGDRPQSAYFVRCDRNSMTQDDLDNGRLVCEVGFAPVRPAEFVVFRIGQWTRRD